MSSPPPVKPSGSGKGVALTNPSNAAMLHNLGLGGAVQWDPLDSRDFDHGTPTQHCIHRIKRDLGAFYADPPAGLFVIPDESDMTKIHALVLGPYDTPYEGGFFYFLMRCPPDYPFKPPRVRLMTTGGGRVRFNPNLYKDGKVCLSILGTWQGPAWSAAQTIGSVLMSIQSLMNEKPYHNEPGFETEHRTGDAARYNRIIQHETIRVAVCDTMENPGMPQSLVDVIRESFVQFYPSYVDILKELMPHEGTTMQDPFNESRGKFQPQVLRKRLLELWKRFGTGSPEPIACEDVNEASNDAPASCTPTSTDTAV